VEVDVWDYLGGAGAWDGRVGGLVVEFGLLSGFVGVEGTSGRGKRPEGEGCEQEGRLGNGDERCCRSRSRRDREN
jgi:hypothetical protein